MSSSMAIVSASVPSSSKPAANDTAWAAFILSTCSLLGQPAWGGGECVGDLDDRRP